MANRSFVLVVAVISIFSCASGHVTITFPPARKYAFDFMDNIRTIGPCGVPKGLGPITDLTAGTTVTVEWHTAYPHLGGYRISLLDELENVRQVFTPLSGQYAGASDPTTLGHNITLPNQECRNCSIQIIRQAGEWFSNCGDYIFYSCADVNILPQNTGNKCGRHGSLLTNGSCSCSNRYAGDQCTFKEDCMTDADCNNHGSCLHLSTTYYPQNQCYCNKGYFGRHCQHESALREKITDFSSYKMLQFSSEYALYHKVLMESNEIEMVMRVQSLTWVGIGWRPSSFRSGCQYFPPLPGIVPGGGPTADPEATSEPEPQFCRGSYKSCGGSNCDYHAEWEFDSVQDEITFTLTARIARTKWVAIGFSDDQFMPASDVYIGWIDSNDQVHVSDRWATGRSPPVNDSIQNHQLRSGSYQNGVLTVSFSRPRSTTDQNDISFSDTDCRYLLYASGGDYQLTGAGDYSFSRHSWREASTERVCIRACAAPTPEPTSEPEATSEPESTSEPEVTSEPEPTCTHHIAVCPNNVCFYVMSWSVDHRTDEVTFTVSGRTENDKWVAIGFSDVKGMRNADIVTFYCNPADGALVIEDRKAAEYYTRPAKDIMSDVTLISGSCMTNNVTFTFKRKRDTMDSQQDYKFSDTHCPFVIGAYGPLNSQREITQHTNRFILSEERICFKACTQTTPVPEGTTEPEGETTSEPEGTGQPEGEGTSEPEGTGEPEGEGTSEPGAEEPSSCGRLPAGTSDTTGGLPHPMDCVDMVIGTARGELSRIGDYYTRGRSTPQYDEFYGGTESLTAAIGYEENGFTTIAFRKKLTATERSDLPILHEMMHVIWARGQDMGRYSHNPLTGIDRVPTASIPNYYYQDELKYHGHQGHRGIDRINFLDGLTGTPTCAHSWGNCSTSGSCHRVSWSLDDLTQKISFTITADLESDQWIGIGFNKVRRMGNADVILGWVANGQVTLMDMRNPDGYGSPINDGQNNQNIEDIQGSRIGKRTTISFKRSLTTSDRTDFQFSANNCPYFIFPKGGSFTTDQSITMHDGKPAISVYPNCLPCSGSPPVNVTSHMYVVEIRLISLAWISAYTSTTSEQHRNLKKDIEEAMTVKFQVVAGFVAIWIIEFSSGSVIAKIGIEFNGAPTLTKAEVQRIMLGIVVTDERIAGYPLDPSHSIRLGDAQPVERMTVPPPVTEEEDIHIAVWFIVGITGAALLVIIMMGLCNCMKNKTSKHPSQKYLQNLPQTVDNKQEKMVIVQTEKPQQPIAYKQTQQPVPYEKWIEANRPQQSVTQYVQYDNGGYVAGEYRIETSYVESTPM